MSNKRHREMIRAARAKAPAPVPETTWTWDPPLEVQLQSKIEALSDIVTLADQVRDSEVFRRFARKIAKAATVMLGKSTITIQTGVGTAKVVKTKAR